MQITNKTDWNTADLRRVFSKVLARWNAVEVLKRRVPSKKLRIKINSTRWANYSGHAYYNSGFMTLNLNKTTLDVRKVAYLFEHELAHCAGYTHKQMHQLNNWKTAGTARYAYVEGEVIRKKEIKPQPKVDRQALAYQRTLDSIQRWNTKAKRAATALKKLNATRKYYEKMFAADGRLAAINKETHNENSS